MEAGWWGAKGQKMGDICNTVNNNFLIETLKNAALEEIPLNSSRYNIRVVEVTVN